MMERQIAVERGGIVVCTQGMVTEDGETWTSKQKYSD